MKKIFSTIILSIIVLLNLAAQETLKREIIYFTNVTNILSIFSMDTKTLKTIPFPGAYISEIILSANGKTLYIRGNENIWLFDTENLEIIDGISHEVGPPVRIALSPDHQSLWVGGYTYADKQIKNGKMKILELKRNEFTHQIEDVYPECIAFSADGKKCYYTEPFVPLSDRISSNKVNVIDAKSMKIINSILVGTRPFSIVVSPNSKFAYVTNVVSDDLSVIDLETEQEIKRIDVRPDEIIPYPGYDESIPDRLKLTNDGKKLFVSHRLAKVITVIDTKTNQIIDRIPTEGWFHQESFALSKDLNYLYHGCPHQKLIEIFDIHTHKLVQNIENLEAPMMEIGKKD